MDYKYHTQAIKQYVVRIWCCALPSSHRAFCCFGLNIHLSNAVPLDSHWPGETHSSHAGSERILPARFLSTSILLLPSSGVFIGGRLINYHRLVGSRVPYSITCSIGWHDLGFGLKYIIMVSLYSWRSWSGSETDGRLCFWRLLTPSEQLGRIKTRPETISPLGLIFQSRACNSWKRCGERARYLFLANYQCSERTERKRSGSFRSAWGGGARSESIT
jgi:hypothetical protein